jgi:hypothetical protein
VSALAAIALSAALFVAFGLLRRGERAPHGCGGCATPAHGSRCGGCPAGRAPGEEA